MDPTTSQEIPLGVITQHDYQAGIREAIQALGASLGEKIAEQGAMLSAYARDIATYREMIDNLRLELDQLKEAFAGLEDNVVPFEATDPDDTGPDGGGDAAL